MKNKLLYLLVVAFVIAICVGGYVEAQQGPATNLTGSAGAAGATGPTGPSGPTGPTGNFTSPMNNNTFLQGKVSGGTAYHLLGFDASNVLQICDSSLVTCAGNFNGTYAITGHAAVGNTAVIDPLIPPASTTATTALNINETNTDNAKDYHFGLFVHENLNPSGPLNANYHAEFAESFDLAIDPSDTHNHGDVYASQGAVFNQGSGTIDNEYGYTAGISNLGTGAIGAAYGMDIYYDPIAGPIGITYGIRSESPNPTTGSVGTHAAFWSDAVGGKATNAYGFWQDEQGVFRIKADNGFDSVYQAVPALYNPLFTKYTPGAANFERIEEHWNGNVAEIGTVKGGTGTLRPVKIIGPSLDVPSTFTVGGSAKGTPFASGTIAATDSATVGCTDTSTAVTNATTAMTVVVSPVGAPAGAGAGNITWQGFATAGNITIRICTIAVVTAAATTYNYVVLN